MDFNNKEFAKFLDAIIEEKVGLLFNRKLKEKNIVTSWVATVVSVVGNSITLRLPGDDTHTIVKKNRTGQTLVANDEVYLFSPTGELHNSYVAIAKNKPV